MKTLKNTLTAIALLVSVQFSHAQSSAMKAPISYQLKNGVTVIVAENLGTQKVYATLSFESTNKYVAEKAAVKELVNTILTQQLPAVNEALSFTDKGINLSSNTDQYENALTAMSAYIAAPAFNEQALTKAKAEILAHINAQDKYYPESITITSVQNLKVSDVNAYYNEIVNPATTYLTVVGNVKPAMIKVYAKKELNNLKAADDQASRTYLVANF